MTTDVEIEHLAWVIWDTDESLTRADARIIAWAVLGAGYARAPF